MNGILSFVRHRGWHWHWYLSVNLHQPQLNAAIFSFSIWATQHVWPTLRAAWIQAMYVTAPDQVATRFTIKNIFYMYINEL